MIYYSQYCCVLREGTSRALQPERWLFWRIFKNMKSTLKVWKNNNVYIMVNREQESWWTMANPSPSSVIIFNWGVWVIRPSPQAAIKVSNSKNWVTSRTPPDLFGSLKGQNTMQYLSVCGSKFPPYLPTVVWPGGTRGICINYSRSKPGFSPEYNTAGKHFSEMLCFISISEWWGLQDWPQVGLNLAHRLKHFLDCFRWQTY